MTIVTLISRVVYYCKCKLKFRENEKFFNETSFKIKA